MAGLFVMLNAFFLAAVQILVTAGAVMVLFLFIIMLLDLTTMEHMPRQKIWMACSLVLALGFIAIVAKTLHATPEGMRTTNSLPTPGAIAVTHYGRILPQSALVNQPVSQSEADKNDDTHRIGRLLFSTNTGINPNTGRQITSYVAPFEITSLLILVATIGVVVICKQDEPRRSPHEEISREAPPARTEKETTPTR